MRTIVWLIELRHAYPTHWVSGMGEWTRDANKAIWFTRKEDAQRAGALAWGKIESQDYLITEHMFIDEEALKPAHSNVDGGEEVNGNR